MKRLKLAAALAKTYKETLADYINYCAIEAKLNEMEAKYEALIAQHAAADDAAKPDAAQIEQNPT